MITYLHCGLMPFKVKVKLDGKLVGWIFRPECDQYYYKPKGGLCGEMFDTLEGVQESLEAK